MEIKGTHNVARGVPDEAGPGALHLGAFLLLVVVVLLLPLRPATSPPLLRPRDDEVLDEHHRRRRLLRTAVGGGVSGQGSAAVEDETGEAHLEQADDAGLVDVLVGGAGGPRWRRGGRGRGRGEEEERGGGAAAGGGGGGGGGRGRRRREEAGAPLGRRWEEEEVEQRPQRHSVREVLHLHGDGDGEPVGMEARYLLSDDVAKGWWGAKVSLESGGAFHV